jgi:glycosyltransferase involved in cell wall biosynthesis
MDLPSISIVTPSYNQGRYLEATIQSVLLQRYPHVEYIVIDGGSTDESVSIIEKYATSLHYWCSEPDRGQADALRKGFDRCSGDVMCWLNSDDLLLPGALTRIGEYFVRHPRVTAVSAGGYMITDRGVPYPRLANYTLGVSASYNRFRFYGQEGVYQQATFWRRDAFVAAGGINPAFGFTMDLDLFLRLARTRRFGKLPRLVACFRQHPESKTTTAQAIHETERSSLLSKHAGTVPRPVRALCRECYTMMSKARKAYLLAKKHLTLIELPDTRDLRYDEDVEL